MISFCTVKFFTSFNFFPTFQEAMQLSLGLKVQRDPKLVKFTLITSSKGHELFTIRSLGIEGGHVINISWDIYQQVVLKERQIWRQCHLAQLNFFTLHLFSNILRNNAVLDLKLKWPKIGEIHFNHFAKWDTWIANHKVPWQWRRSCH
jgi:hypothetical protein